MLAIAAPIILIGIGVAVDFSNSVTMRARTQAAADSAALAATTSLATSITNGSPITTTQAQAIATEFFNANAPSQAISGETSFSASTSQTASSVTTLVSYSGKSGALVSGFIGSPLTVSVSASATSAITTTVTNPVGTINGTGWIAEDPIVHGADGVTTGLEMCDVSHKTWYNLLSDSQFEVNANCDGTQVQAELYQFEYLVGTHRIFVSPTLQQTSWFGGVINGQYVYVNREYWIGDVTIDGQFYPATAGVHTYLNDTANGVKVTVTVGQPGVSGSAANYVTVSTPVYSTSLAYDSDDDGAWNFGIADIQIAATKAGACGALGGVWGLTTAHVDDSNWGDFAVSGPTATASQFGVTCSTQTQTASTAKITQ